MAKKKGPGASNPARPGQERPGQERPGPARPGPFKPGSPASAQRAASAAQDPFQPDLPIAYRPVAWWPSAVLGLVAFLLYVNTFGHGYVLDDVAAITQNLFVKEGLSGIPKLLRIEFWHFSNISLGYYRPLSLITFAIEQELFGSNPGISHVINAGLYAVTGGLLGLLLQKWLPGQVIVAFLIGLLFVAHPVHTEVVANIKSRDEIMSFLFIISTMLLYWRYLETSRPGWLVGAALTQYLAFMSKESAIVSLALYPAMQYYFARRSLWRSLVSLWPFLLVAALFFYQKVAMIGTLSGKPPVDWANYPYALEKTQGPTTFKFFAYYLKLLFLPHPLVYDYSYNVIPSARAGDPAMIVGFLLLLTLVGLAWVGFRRRTLWGFGLFWFFVTMMPALGFIFSRGGILAERFLYAPVLGFAICLVWLLHKGLVRGNAADTGLSRATLPRYGALLGLLAVVVGLYAFKTIDRNRAWESNYVLFNNDLPNAWNSCQVQRQVANEWIEKGLRAKTKPERDTFGRLAINHLKESVRIYPTFGEAYFSMAYVFQNITPNVDSAKYYYKETIRTASAYAPAYNNLGVIYQNEGKLPLASYYYNKSVAVNPAYQDGRNNAAALKANAGVDVHALPDSVLLRN